MPTPRKPRQQEHASTYFVQNRRSKDELTRVTIQDQMITASMGGALPEQPDPGSLHRILDIACGTGGWIIEAAQTYPSLSHLIGIDISGRMIDYARAQAKTHHVDERVEFHVMDALRPLEFPDEFFDLVNLRFGVSFMRTWDWPGLIIEMLRITRKSGMLRLTDNVVLHESSSPAFNHFFEMILGAFFQSGHVFEQEGTGLTAHLAPMLERYGCKQVQTKAYAFEFRAGTPRGQAYCEDGTHALETLRPYIEKWGSLDVDYDAFQQQALAEMCQPDFHSTWRFLTAWGSKD